MAHRRKIYQAMAAGSRFNSLFIFGLFTVS